MLQPIPQILTGETCSTLLPDSMLSSQVRVHALPAKRSLERNLKQYQCGNSSCRRCEILNAGGIIVYHFKPEQHHPEIQELIDYL